MRASNRAGELEAIYEDADRRLRQIVAVNVRAPEAVIEDACQTAWLRYAARRDHVSERMLLAWLVTTATREALRLLGRAAREVPLEELSPVAAGTVPDPEAISQLRGRFAELRALTLRQRRLIWLQGLGFSYEEMARQEQATRRTVERQVLRARRRLRLT